MFPNMVSLKGRMLSVGDSLGLVNGLEAVDGYLVLRDEQVGTMYTILKPDLSYSAVFVIQLKEGAVLPEKFLK